MFFLRSKILIFLIFGAEKKNDPKKKSEIFFRSTFSTRKKKFFDPDFFSRVKILSGIQKTYLERCAMSANMLKMQILNLVVIENSPKTQDLWACSPFEPFGSPRFSPIGIFEMDFFIEKIKTGKKSGYIFRCRILPGTHFSHPQSDLITS